MKLGLIDNWLRHVQDVNQQHAAELNRLIPDARRPPVRADVLGRRSTCARRRSCRTRGACQALTVHAWVYRLDDGILRDLQFDVDSNWDLLRKTPASDQRSESLNSGNSAAPNLEFKRL